MSLVPLAYFGDSPSIGLATIFGVTASWGIYNINELDKDNYTYSQVLQRNMAIPVGIFALGSGAYWLLKKAKPDTKAKINVTPLNNGAILSLSSNF